MTILLVCLVLTAVLAPALLCARERWRRLLPLVILLTTLSGCVWRMPSIDERWARLREQTETIPGFLWINEEGVVPPWISSTVPVQVKGGRFD